MTFESYGQHCPYDPICVLVLDIKYNNKVIDGLQVNLVSKNKSSTSDTCSEAENKSFMKLNSKGEYNNDHFTFAKNMYIVFVGNSIGMFDVICKVCAVGTKCNCPTSFEFFMGIYFPWITIVLFLLLFLLHFSTLLLFI